MIKQATQHFSFHHFARLLVQHRKQAGMYVLFLLVVSFNLCLFLSNLHTPVATPMVNAVQLICFGIMGVVNVWFFYKPAFLAAFAVSNARPAFVGLLFVVIALLLFVYYSLTGNNTLVMAFASSGSFLLPFLVYQAYIAFMHIPAKQYAVWYLPTDTGVTTGAFAANAASAMQVQLGVARRLGDAGFHTFPVTTSGKMKLGKIFERFIEEQAAHGPQAAIETTDKYQRTVGWQFYEQKWAGMYKRNLNPAMSLLENNIRPNARIMVTRICEVPVVQDNAKKISA